MLSGTIVFLVLMLELGILTIADLFFNILLPYQLYEMIISTLLLMGFTWMYAYTFDSDKMITTLVPLLYLNWYFFVKLLSNILNKDSTGVVRFD